MAAEKRGWWWSVKCGGWRDWGNSDFDFRTAQSVGDGVRRQVDEADLFLDAEPRALFVGSQHLDDYLRESGMGWVLRLGALLADIDLSALTSCYKAYY